MHRKFGCVEGVPRGGVRLATALERYITVGDDLLIVDDVLTTGLSMERHRDGREAFGIVVFARGLCPNWISSIWNLGFVPAPMGRAT